MDANQKIEIMFTTNAGNVSEEIEKLGIQLKKLTDENSCKWWQFWKWFERTTVVINLCEIEGTYSNPPQETGTGAKEN